MPAINRKRNNKILFRLSDSELALFNKKQTASGLNKTDFLLKMLHSTRIKIYCFNEAIKPLYAELRKIGVNINQIAYNANVGRYAEAAQQLMIIRNAVVTATNRINTFLDDPLSEAEIKKVD